MIGTNRHRGVLPISPNGFYVGKREVGSWLLVPEGREREVERK
jgi:hypothetical protein